VQLAESQAGLSTVDRLLLCILSACADQHFSAGIRTTLSGPSDYENDGYCGFEIVEAREIDTIGMHGIIKKIRDRVGTENPVYLSIDIVGQP
jgi:arginase family enzyme